MSNSHDELRSSYEDFLHADNFSQLERIATAIDDHNARRARTASKSKAGDEGSVMGAPVGWGCPRVKIRLSELRADGAASLERRLRLDPLRHLRALEAACHNVGMEERPGYDKNDIRVKVAIEGPLGAKPASPRTLLSSCLRHLVCVEGVAIKVSGVKPKIVRSVHFCPATKQHQTRDYTDATDANLGLPAIDEQGRELPDRIIGITPATFPTRDADKNILETEFGLSKYKDHQTITLQEMPERAPMGQLPRSVELILDDDLVDKVKPGDRVQVVGVYRALATTSNGQSSTSGLFKTVVLVNNIQILGQDTNQLNYLPADIKNIKSLAKHQSKHILSILGRSLAPSIHGHGNIKKALILQLLSGCEKNLDNGTHLRGDINILMVGDPSTAKSQLLRAIMSIAPLAISTTGKGSSGVGLTAAVTSDPETRERRLEAGAMVLADRGIVCVDEFDKMGEGDRVAIHEAMEQQTVTIAKAGIHASLNARCSVLAAANPVYGQYDRKRRIQENIGLPDSLLSRFDLLFVVLDHIDPESDRRIASHVIRGHRYKSANGRSGHDSDDDYNSDDDEDRNDVTNSRTPSMWKRSRYSSNVTAMQTNRAETDGESDDSDNLLQHDFLRKYLHFAKTRFKPTLTEEAREYIASRYAEMRSRQNERTLPVTARTLETVIRLASAHAKARLSKLVEADPDCIEAMDILSFALYHENINNTSSNGAQHDIGNAALSPPHLARDDGNDAKRMRLNESEDSMTTRTDAAADTEIDIATRIWKEVVSTDGGGMELDSICSDIADRASVRSAVEMMEKKDKVMISEGMVYQV